MNIQIKILSFIFLALFVSGCAGARYAQTDIGQAFDDPVTIKADWGEVYCGRGTVCAEVEVRRVEIDNRDGGSVGIVLHNRTKNQAAVQMQLQIVDEDMSQLDTTNFENVALEPRAERRVDIPGIYKSGAKVRIVLRQKDHV